MLDRIRENARATELLADVYDFDPGRTDPVEELRLDSGAELRVIGGDAAGGTFYVCDGGPVLYASSEGSAGIIAADLKAALELFIGVPVWQDVVTEVPDLDAMRDAFDSSYAELKEEYEPEIDEHGDELAAALGLDRLPVEDLLIRLRTSVADLSPNYLPRSAAGDRYEPLN